MREYYNPLKIADADAGESGDSGKNKDNEALQQERLIIRVSDTGIGIPEDDILLITEPFRLASNSPNLGVKGRGLGLAMVQKLVKEVGGCVCCKSEEGVGTAFSLFFPIA